MARLEEPVMNTSRRAPAASASSTAYWISGLSTMGSISFGLALVAGRNRVPRPATGKTATSMRLFCGLADIRAPVQGPEPYHALETAPAGPRREDVRVCVLSHLPGPRAVVRTRVSPAWLPAPPEPPFHCHPA